ncbi:hypothetical protein [Azohydromonas caseinilytica]|uniref:Uncharacterized protein n=1 Tax=Azohydromonas caseinilytica TaxID=2728836 RepID=A0A848FC66_9BURK|nr:hypothetical protein [Azohydromonas caseinilytica]NML17797.1 hypothetical protein [Azohydromonas caseinilytica]
MNFDIKPRPVAATRSVITAATVVQNIAREPGTALAGEFNGNAMRPAQRAAGTADATDTPDAGRALR